MLVLDHADHTIVTLSVGPLCGIQLSSLPDSRNVREGRVAHDAEGWEEAMDKEMETLNYHDIYKLVLQTKSLRTFELGWVLDRKFKNMVFDKNKARVVTKANYQRHGIDYDEPLPRRCVLSCFSPYIAATRDLDIIQCDITSAHLHGTLKEDIYMGQPDGYTIPGKEARVWWLQKEL